MSNIKVLQRLQQRAAAQSEEPALPRPSQPEPPQAAEAKQLARELTQALADELDRYRRASERDKERLGDPAEPTPDWLAQGIIDGPAEQFTFGEYHRLHRVDPVLALARWERVIEQAKTDLDSGWLAARVLEQMGGSAWERACFCAVRQRLRLALAPRDDAESLLIDELTQYEMLRQKWLGLLAQLTNQPLTSLRLNLSKEDKVERKFTEADAAREAVRMVERFHRLYHDTLRTLVSLRRPGRSVFVGRAGQVNLANGPQQNVNSTCCKPSE